MNVTLPEWWMVFNGLKGAVFFAAIFFLSWKAWSGWLGSPGRAMSVPLLVVPLAADWCRYALGVSHAAGFAVGVLLAVVAALGTLAWRRRAPWVPGLRWWTGFLVLLGLYVAVRLWWFTGSVPTPADDIYAGHKASALYFAHGWPAPHPEAPEIPFSYYYFSHGWVAGLAHWLDIDFWTGWWLVAVVLCLTGSLLVYELVMPWFRRSLIWSGIGAALSAVGCSYVWILAIFSGLPLRYWGGVTRSLVPEGLDFVAAQQTMAYWMPFAVFSAGVLLVVFRWLLHPRLGGSVVNLVWSAFAGAAVLGYCAFFALGAALSAVPVVLGVCSAYLGWKRMLPRLAAWTVTGLASVVLAFPFLTEMLARDAAGRPEPHGVFWLEWAGRMLAAGQGWKVAGTLALCVLLMILAAPAGWMACVRLGALRSRSMLLHGAVGVMVLGTVVCLLGVTLDFVPKYGVFTALSGLVVCLLVFRPGSSIRWVLLAGLSGPLLLWANAVRANLQKGPADRLWMEIDRRCRDQWVVMDVPVELRDRLIPWDDVMPFFARARFIAPAEQVDETSRNFMRSTAPLADFPRVHDRLMRMGAKEAYLLRPAQEQVDGRAPLFELFGPFPLKGGDQP